MSMTRGLNLDSERLFVSIQLPLSSLPNLKDTKPEKDNFATMMTDLCEREPGHLLHLFKAIAVQ